VTRRRADREHRRLAPGARQQDQHDLGPRHREGPFRGVHIRAAAVRATAVQVAAVRAAARRQAAEVIRAAGLPRAADALRSRDD